MKLSAQKLNARQRKFVAAVLSGCSHAEAARRAGYSERRAAVAGAELVRNRNVAAAIEAGLQRVEQKSEVTAERIVAELAKLAFSDLRGIYGPDGQMLPPSQWPDDVAAAIAGTDTIELPGDAGGLLKKVKRWDKVKALELLMKHKGMLVERVEHSVDESLEALILGARKAKGDAPEGGAR